MSVNVNRLANTSSDLPPMTANQAALIRLFAEFLMEEMSASVESAGDQSAESMQTSRAGEGKSKKTKRKSKAKAGQ